MIYNATVELRKVKPSRYGVLTAYEVFKDSKSIGFVWSYEGFSYRGTDGWNSGLRSVDFHPTRWTYGEQIGQERLTRYSRKQAVDGLLREAEERKAK